MDPKPRPNREKYLETLRRMTGEERVRKAFELSEMAKQAMLDGLRSRHPEADEATIRRMYLARLSECHNRNY